MTPARFHPTPLDQSNTRCSDSTILPQTRQDISNYRTALAFQVRLLKEQNTTAIKVLNFNINPVMLLRHVPAEGQSVEMVTSSNSEHFNAPIPGQEAFEDWGQRTGRGVLWLTMVFSVATSKNLSLPDRGDQQNVGQLFCAHTINKVLCAKDLLRDNTGKPNDVSASMSVADHSVSLRHPKST